MSQPNFGVTVSQRREKLSPRRQRQRGAELVEFNLVLIPMLSLIFLAVDTAWAIYSKSALQEAVREGVRYGVTGQTVATGTCLDQSIKDVVVEYSMGFLTSSNQSSISIAYYSPTAPGTNLAGSAGATAGGNILQVNVTGVPVKLLAPFFITTAPMTLSASATDVLESSPGGVAPCE